MANQTNRARCTCGHCARCAKILRAALRRESAAPAQRTGIGPVARPGILDLLATSRDEEPAISPAPGWTPRADTSGPSTHGLTVDATPETQQKRAAA